MFKLFFEELGHDCIQHISNERKLCLDVNVHTSSWRCVDLHLKDGSVKVYDVEYLLKLNMHDNDFLEKLKTAFSSVAMWEKTAIKTYDRKTQKML